MARTLPNGKQEEWAGNINKVIVPRPPEPPSPPKEAPAVLPSAGDLDKVEEETKAKELTATPSAKPEWELVDGKWQLKK